MNRWLRAAGATTRLAGALILGAGSAAVEASPAARSAASGVAGPGHERSVPGADTLPRHVRSSLSLYRDHPSVADVRRILLRWAQQGGPTSASDSVAVAALWRRAGQYRSALEALPSEHAADGTPRPRVVLERARILLQAPPSGPGIPGTSEERRRTGGAAFWSSCEGMDAETRGALWEDLRGLFTPDEHAAWRRLRPGADGCEWVRSLVDERAFRMAVSAEERLQVHYARLHEARALFHIRTARLTDDLADRLGRADSLEIDDRGLVFLRMGEALAIVEPFLDLNETWAYYRPQGPRVFHFAPISKTGLRALGDYRLLENLAHASGLTMPTELMGVGGGALAYLYQSRRVLDYLYEDYHFRQMDSRMRAAGDRLNPGFYGFLAWERELNEADAAYAISGIPDAPDVTPGIEFAYEALRFREPGADLSEVWFLAATRVGDLTARPAIDPATGEGGLVGYDVGAQLAFLASGRMRRSDIVVRPWFDDPLADDDAIPVRFSRTLGPGTYPYTLVLRDVGAERGNLGNWALDTVTVSARQSGLATISDIAVAADSGGSWTRDGEVFLRVDPTHVVAPDGAAHVYFETYGLRPGSSYDVEIRVIAEEAADAVFDVTPDDLAFVLRFPSVATADGAGNGIGRHHLRVELGPSPPGAYLLAVRVTDRFSGSRSLPAVTPLYRPAVRAAHWSDAPRRRSTIVEP